MYGAHGDGCMRWWYAVYVHGIVAVWCGGGHVVAVAMVVVVSTLYSGCMVWRWCVHAIN